MPFRMPTRSAARRRRMPSKPKPNSGVWISRAYCGLTVVISSASLMPPLRKLMLSPVFEPLDREQSHGEIEPRQPVGREQPLVGEVVNGEHARRRRRARDAPRTASAGRPARARLPVVRVHDDGRTPRRAGKLERGADQQREPPRVVGIVGVVGAVQRLAIEQVRAVDEHRAGAALRAAPRRIRRLACTPPTRHRKALDELARGHAAVSWHDQGHSPAEARQRRRQRAERRRPDRRFSRTERLRPDDQHRCARGGIAPIVSGDAERQSSGLGSRATSAAAGLRPDRLPDHDQA